MLPHLQAPGADRDPERRQHGVAPGGQLRPATGNGRHPGRRGQQQGAPLRAGVGEGPADRRAYPGQRRPVRFGAEHLPEHPAQHTVRGRVQQPGGPQAQRVQLAVEDGRYARAAVAGAELADAAHMAGGQVDGRPLERDRGPARQLGLQDLAPLLTGGADRYRPARPRGGRPYPRRLLGQRAPQVVDGQAGQPAGGLLRAERGGPDRPGGPGVHREPARPGEARRVVVHQRLVGGQHRGPLGVLVDAGEHERGRYAPAVRLGEEVELVHGQRVRRGRDEQQPAVPGAVEHDLRVRRVEPAVTRGVDEGERGQQWYRQRVLHLPGGPGGTARGRFRSGAVAVHHERLGRSHRCGNGSGQCEQRLYHRGLAGARCPHDHDRGGVSGLCHRRHGR